MHLPSQKVKHLQSQRYRNLQNHNFLPMFLQKRSPTQIQTYLLLSHQSKCGDQLTPHLQSSHAHLPYRRMYMRILRQMTSNAKKGRTVAQNVSG